MERSSQELEQEDGSLKTTGQAHQRNGTVFASGYH